MSCCCGVMTTAGDILSHDGTSPIRVAISSEDKVLTVGSSGLPEWKDIPSQAPFSVAGDILTRNSTGNVVLPMGDPGEVLTVKSGFLEWLPPLPVVGEHDEVSQVLQLVHSGNPLYGGFQAGWGLHLDSGDVWSSPNFAFPSGSNISLNTSNSMSSSWTRIGNQVTGYMCVSMTINDLTSYTNGDDVSFTLELPVSRDADFTHAQEARVTVSASESNPSAIVSFDQLGGRAIPNSQLIGVSARVRSTGQRNVRFAICANYSLE